MWLQIGRVRQDDSAIDRVLQLADVARPIEVGQAGQGLGRNPDYGLAFLHIEAAHKAGNQGGDVFLALAQGRRLDREDVQAIEQVLTEPAFLYRLAEVAIGG